MKPPMPTLSPVCTSILVERLTACAALSGVAVGDAVAVAVALAVAVAAGWKPSLSLLGGTRWCRVASPGHCGRR